MASRLPTLSTDRLLLRPFCDDDAEEFAALNADPIVTEFLGGPLSRAASDALLARIVSHVEEHGFGPWVVELPGVLTFGGFVGLWRTEFDAHFTPTVEVAWRLLPALWGQGFATEGARAALEFGFSQLQLPRIHSFTVASNVRSQRVMQKLGLRRAEPHHFDHPRLPEGHPLRVHVLFEITRSDWSAQTHA